MFNKLKQKVKKFLGNNQELYDIPEDFESLTARIIHLEKRVTILEDENIGFINDIYELENIIESLKYNK
jgi:hypothetical protein